MSDGESSIAMPQSWSLAAFSGLNSRSKLSIGALSPSRSFTFSALKPMPTVPQK